MAGKKWLGKNGWEKMAGEKWLGKNGWEKMASIVV